MKNWKIILTLIVGLGLSTYLGANSHAAAQNNNAAWDEDGGDLEECLNIRNLNGDCDGDTIKNFFDNCPLNSNKNQLDTDDDGIGDVCDRAQQPNPQRPGFGCQVATMGADCDRDGVINGEDNCPLVVNADQTDSDEDNIGDACDEPEPAEPLDTDGDGTPDELDNCPEHANADQNDDIDYDGIGNACDNTPNVPSVDDLRAQAPQGDFDGDGVVNNTDNCPLTANEDQADLDNDGAGSICDETEPVVEGCHDNLNKTSLSVYASAGDCLGKDTSGANFGVFGPMSSSDGGFCALNPHSSTNLAPFAALFVGLSCLIARRRYE